MHAAVTDTVCSMVCVFIMTVSTAKSAEPIKLPFGLLTHVGRMNHVLDILAPPGKCK